MAKKKSRKQVIKNKQETVSTIFDCPFCSNKKTVEVLINKKELRAEIKCRVCTSHWSRKWNNLIEPIDVYSEWIDECEKINKY